MAKLKVNGGGAGGAPIGPAAAEGACETVKQVEAVTLDNHKRDRDQPGRRQPCGDWKRLSRSGPQTEQQKQAKRGVGELGEEFESEVDDRARGGDRTRHSGHRHCARTEDQPAHLG